MTDGFNPIETNKERGFSDDTLRAYLLGQLDEETRLRLDQSLLADDALAEQVRVAESGLIDECAGGELETRDAELVRTVFLVTDARREQFRLASALRDQARRPEAIAAVPIPAETRTWRGTLAEFFVLRPGPVWAAAGSFAVLLLVLGLAWYVSRRTPQSDAPIAKQSPVISVSPEGAASPGQVAQVPPVEVPSPQVKPTPSEPPVAIASFVLMPGALRSSGAMTRVAVPRGEAILRLSLVLENPAAGPFQADIANADGKTVTVRRDLKPHRNGQTKITFDVPARLIQPDDYQIKLSRKTGGQMESVGRYYFRALPE